MNHQIRLKSRPTGEPTAANFEPADAPVPEAGDGEVLRRTIYLSLDPYMRGRMSDAPSYAAPVKIGDVMGGHTVSEVVESRNPDFTTGDFVTGYDGWQAYGVSNGKELRKLDPKAVPISTAIGVLGMPGMTAFVGLMDIGQPKPGETVVVSAASGAVGAVVGQLAKIKGCRAVGIAGSPDKCRYVVEELGFDACINYKTDDLVPALKAACPDGVDIYFENVGGAVFAAILRVINSGARIPLCGMISEYNATANTAGSEPAAAARPPRDDQGVHRQRSPRSRAGVPAGGRAAGACRAGSSSARTSSTVSTTRRPRSSACWKGRTSAS